MNRTRFPSLRDRRLRPLALVLATTAIIGSCGDGNPLSPMFPNVAGTVSKIPVASRAEAILMLRTPSAERGARGGTTVDLDALLLKRNAKLKEKDKHVDWISTDTVIATVDSAGRVTAQDLGSVIIVADYKDHAADSVLVEVVPVPVKTVTIAGPDSISIADVVTLVATPRDSAGDPLEGRVVSWTTSAPAVATVSAGGDVSALTEGVAGISATVETIASVHALRVWPQPIATIVIEPALATVPQFHKVRFSATAYDRHGNVLTGRALTWHSSNPAVFYIKANADTAAGKDLGSALVVVTAEQKVDTAEVTVTEPVEARALWVSRFDYTTASAVNFAKIATIFQRAAQANFNIVYFQVRTSGDALYFSDIEPCSPRMCGFLGGPRPAQDPLVVALAEAAKYGIEVHAWLNAYTGFIAGSTAACNQFISSAPMNWLMADSMRSVSTKTFTSGVITRQVDNCLAAGEYMWVSPGVPEVRTRLAVIAADIARRYGALGLRGIHLDRIRFPSSTVSYDPWSQEAFRTATGAYPSSNTQASWQEFRRGFVNQGVREVYDTLQGIDPSLVLSAAVFPGYKPRANWSAQWGWRDLFQDPQAWTEGGYLDVEAVMSYPATSGSTSWIVKTPYCTNTDWTCTMDDHIARIEGDAGRQVYVGVGAIKGWTEVEKQITLAHDRTATGISVYSFTQMDAIAGGWAALAAGPFKHKATIPAMPWKSPSAPRVVQSP